MEGVIGGAVLSFEGANVRINVGAACYRYGLWNGVDEKRGLRNTIGFAKAAEPASLKVCNHSVMKVVALHLCCNDPKCRV